MKRYIKSTIATIYTLKEWANNFDGKRSAEVFIDLPTSDSLYNCTIAQLQEWLNHPDEYICTLHDYSDWLVVDVDASLYDNPYGDYYELYLEKPN